MKDEVLTNRKLRITRGVIYTAVFLGIGWLGLTIIDIRGDFGSLSSYYRSSIHMTDMYDLAYKYEASSDASSGKELLDACAKVLADHSLLQMSGLGKRSGKLRRDSQLDDKLRRAKLFAQQKSTELLEVIPAEAISEETFISLSRTIGGALFVGGAHRKTAISAFDSQPDRTIAYILASSYTNMEEFQKALDQLKIAMGAEWAATGRVDDWASVNFSPGRRSHYWYGYLWYTDGEIDRALHEYQMSRGSDKTREDMQLEYRKPFDWSDSY